nr:hypothetical protein MACL_00001952 [Theileria orientalis]
MVSEESEWFSSYWKRDINGHNSALDFLVDTKDIQALNSKKHNQESRCKKLKKAGTKLVIDIIFKRAGANVPHENQAGLPGLKVTRATLTSHW